MSHQPSHARQPHELPPGYDRDQAAAQFGRAAWMPVSAAQSGVRTTPPGRVVMSAAASFWYVLGCIAFGGAYLAKVPAKKALAEAGMAEMTAAEKFWYVLMCIAFGGGYLAKLPVKKALTEMH